MTFRRCLNCRPNHFLHHVSGETKRRSGNPLSRSTSSHTSNIRPLSVAHPRYPCSSHSSCCPHSDDSYSIFTTFTLFLDTNNHQVSIPRPFPNLPCIDKFAPRRGSISPKKRDHPTHPCLSTSLSALHNRRHHNCCVPAISFHCKTRRLRRATIFGSPAGSSQSSAFSARSTLSQASPRSGPSTWELCRVHQPCTLLFFPGSFSAQSTQQRLR